MSNTKGNIVSLDTLKKYQSTLTKKIMKKFGTNNSPIMDGWGWFVDPDTNYDYSNKYDKFKQQKLSISIPDTIQEMQEYSTLRMRRSLKSINNFQNAINYNNYNNNNYNNSFNNGHFNNGNLSYDDSNISAYNIVGLCAFVCLIYVFI